MNLTPGNYRVCVSLLDRNPVLLASAGPLHVISFTGTFTPATVPRTEAVPVAVTINGANLSSLDVLVFLPGTEDCPSDPATVLNAGIQATTLAPANGATLRATIVGQRLSALNRMCLQLRESGQYFTVNPGTALVGGECPLAGLSGPMLHGIASLTSDT